MRSGISRFAGGTRGPREDLFLAQKVEVSVTAGVERIDNRGMDSRKVVGVTAVRQRKGKGNFQRVDGFAVFSVALNVP